MIRGVLIANRKKTDIVRSAVLIAERFVYKYGDSIDPDFVAVSAERFCDALGIR